jgi:tetratricopeptide (TPR) repeat protein
MWAPVTLCLLLLMQSSASTEEGIKALETERYADAEEIFLKVLESQPEDYPALFHLALAQSLQGKDEDAIRNYRKVLELKPGLYQAELNLGILLVQSNQGAEALPHLIAAAESKPADYRVRFHLAEAHMAAGGLDSAAAEFQKALELNPQSAAAQLGLGRVYLQQGKMGDAVAAYRKAAERDASYREALLELAQELESAGDKVEAAALYQEFPENPAARERVADILIAAGRPEEAIPHLEWVATRSPSAANRLALALAYVKTQQVEKGLALARAAVDTEPADPELRMAYGRLLRDAKQMPRAAEEFLAAVKLRPDMAEGWSELAAVLVLLENYPQAVAALDRLRALNAETTGHLYLRAIVLDKTNQYQEALLSYSKFLEQSEGKHPDEEFLARQRSRVIEKILSKK